MKMFKKLTALALTLLLCSTAAFAVCADGIGDNDTPDDWDGIQKVEYTIAAAATEGGSVTGGGVVEEGEEVTLTAIADEGYEFVGWFDGETKVADTATYTVVATADKIYTAKFEVVKVKYNGDVAVDGKINTKDVTFLKMFIKGTLSSSQLATYDTEADDLDGDGKVNTKDVTFLKMYIKGSLSAAQIAKYNLPPKA